MKRAWCFLLAALVCPHLFCGFANVGVGMMTFDPWSWFSPETSSAAGGVLSQMPDSYNEWEIIPSVQPLHEPVWEDVMQEGGYVCVAGRKSCVTLGHDSTYQARFFYHSAATQDFWLQTGADTKEHAWSRNEGTLALAALALRSGGRESQYHQLSDEEKQKQARQELDHVCQALGIRLEDARGNSEVCMMLARSLSNHLSERFVFLDDMGEGPPFIHESPFYPVFARGGEVLLQEVLSEE